MTAPVSMNIYILFITSRKKMNAIIRVPLNRHPVDSPLLLTVMYFDVGGFSVIQAMVDKAGIVQIPATADLMTKRPDRGPGFSAGPVLGHNPLPPVDKHGRFRVFVPYHFKGLNDLLFLVLFINVLIH